jgi:hypothetical protein
VARKQTVETISTEELLELQARAEKFAPEKIVIVAGPTFGTIIKVVLLGVALGAAGATLLQKSSHGEDAGFTAGEAQGGTSFQARAEALLGRAKILASRAKDAAQAVAENVRPVFQDAVEEGKASARKAEHDLEEEISREEA